MDPSCLSAATLAAASSAGAPKGRSAPAREPLALPFSLLGGPGYCALGRQVVSLARGHLP